MDLKFAWAAGALATTHLTDYAQPQTKNKSGASGAETQESDDKVYHCTKTIRKRNAGRLENLLRWHWANPFHWWNGTHRLHDSPAYQ